MRKRKSIGFSLLLVGAVACQNVAAHGVGTSYLSVSKASGARAVTDIRVDLSLKDLQVAIGLDIDGDNRITWGEVSDAGEALSQYVTARVVVKQRGQNCTLQSPRLSMDQHADGPYAVLRFTPVCLAAGVLSVNSKLFFDIDESHRSLLNIDTPTASNVVVLTADSHHWAEAASGGSTSAFVGFVVQGVWHIWTGLDHLAFLFLLLLPLILQQSNRVYNRAMQGLRIVTAFTLAHSITLAAAAFGYIDLPTRWVESAIAASIVIAGVANLLPRIRRPGVALAFGFGLVHGLGFASALAGISTSTHGLLLPLLGFNLGVECGQLVVVALAFPLLLLASRSLRLRQPIVALGSAVVAAVGAMWLVQRVLPY
jgi:HupE / UreJ protein